MATKKENTHDDYFYLYQLYFIESQLTIYKFTN